MESTLLVEREEFDDNGAISNTVYVRPISTKRGWQYRVGLEATQSLVLILDLAFHKHLR